MGYKEMKAKLLAIKSNIVSKTKASLQEYRERKAKERQAEKEFREKEREKYVEAQHRARLQIAAKRGKEQAIAKSKRTGFFGSTPSLLGNTGSFSSNPISGPFAGGMQLHRNVITGESNKPQHQRTRAIRRKPQSNNKRQVIINI